MKIRNILFIFFSYILIYACHPENGESLFDGKSLNNWSVKARPEDLDKNFWIVKDGYIEANSMGRPDHDYVWLYSLREFNNFELNFEFQAFRDSPGNSGIQIRSRYDDVNFWLNGPQIDIHPPGYWRTGMMWDETRGNQRWLFPEIPEDSWVDSTMAINNHIMYFSDDSPAWNKMKVRAKGADIQAWLNGMMITDYNGNGILNDSLHTEKKVGMNGHIAFQIHTGDELKIRYRKIYIRELN
jgi:hypothetical protein